MRFKTKIRRRQGNPNAAVEASQQEAVEILQRMQRPDYDALRLHFTGLILQGLAAHEHTPLDNAIQVAIHRGGQMAAAWIASCK